MRVTGIIAEYNPFHNGHAYQIQEAKKVTNADYILVVMSGDYVQRGCPAMLDKYVRTEMALLGGADVVLELPCAYATGSAEYFAMGAISLLDKCGIVDSLCFGSECGNLNLLNDLADHLASEQESPLFQQVLTSCLKNGMTYPAARSFALSYHCKDLLETDMTSDSQNYSWEELEQVLQLPNNTLGIEYLKSLKRRHSSITPYTLLRMDAGYHSQVPQEHFASATAIRTMFEQMNSKSDFENYEIWTKIKNYVPKDLLDVLKRNYAVTYPIQESDFSLLLYYQLLLLKHQKISYSIYQDVSKELAQRICNLLPFYSDYTSFAAQVKSRQYTLTRINRCLLHTLLGIRAEDYKEYSTDDFIPYVRVLGFRSASSSLLKAMKQTCSIPIINKTANAFSALSPVGKKMLDQEFYVSSLYQKVQENKFHTTLKTEFTQGIIIR